MSLMGQLLAQTLLPNDFAGGAVERHHRELKRRRGRSPAAEASPASATLSTLSTLSTLPACATRRAGRSALTTRLLTVGATGSRLLLQASELRRNVQIQICLRLPGRGNGSLNEHQVVPDD